MRNDLYQDEVWITKDGHTLRLVDMTPEHRQNLLAWIRRNSSRLKLSAELSLCTGPEPSGDAASDCFDSMFDEVLRTPAAQWIEEQPLVVRLRELVAADVPQRRRRALVMPVPAGALGGRK